MLGIIGIVRSGRLRSGRATSIVGLTIGTMATALTVFAMLSYTTPIDGRELERQIAEGIYDQIQERVTVACPEDVPSERGATFDCFAYGDEGINSIINVTVQDDGNIRWRSRRL